MPDTHGQEKPAPVKLPFWRTAPPDIAGVIPVHCDAGNSRCELALLPWPCWCLPPRGTPPAAPTDYAWPQMAGLIAGCAIRMEHFGHGPRVTLVLEDAEDTPSFSIRQPKMGILPFFLVQIALATAIYYLAHHAGSRT